MVCVRSRMEEVAIHQVYRASSLTTQGSANSRDVPRAGRTWLRAEPGGLSLLEKASLAHREVVCQGPFSPQFLRSEEGV